MIDIFNIQPTVVTRDLSGKSFLIYGERKSGKTSNAVKFPKPILLAFEKGYSMISGVYAQPINIWREALEVKKQLLRNAEDVAEERAKGNAGAETVFKTVIVDTADIAYDCCERYVLDKEGVEHLDESTNMRAYRALSREYDKFFQEIVKAGYTLVIISHATSKQIKEKGEKYDKTIPTLPDRGFQVIARLVDVCAYASYETDADSGTTTSMLTMRGSKNLEAGSRNKYMSEKIPFTYQALCDDMAQAINRLEAEDGATVVNTPTQMHQDVTEKVDFKAVKSSIGKIARALVKLDENEEEPHYVDDYKRIAESYIGRNKLVKDCDEAQADMLALILEDLQEYVKENKIKV